ncbi:MAG: N-acetylmuramoyl-L-alanine amidase [Paludibacteraceae bacterium]|nr:N-acetylmuramoyl-L-alanine amidase [Paludibacteraceae bacterium]
MKKSDIDSIVIHCSASRAGQDLRASDIDKMHKERGFKMIGYHYVIDLDGTVETGRPLTMDGAHCNTAGLSGKAYNKHSIGICYIGGLDKNGNPADTRTDAQKRSMSDLIYQLKIDYNITDILGHRDTSPDKNSDGKISKNEWIKQCPCFDVRSEYPVAICVAKRK